MNHSVNKEIAVRCLSSMRSNVIPVFTGLVITCMLGLCKSICVGDRGASACI